MDDSGILSRVLVPLPANEKPGWGPAARSVSIRAMTTQSVRVGTQEIVIAPGEAEDGSFVASVRGGKRPAQTFVASDWSDPRTRLDAARTICESFAITRNNQNLNKVAKAIDDAMA